MSYIDEWGKDPAVRYLRKVFASIEEGQKRLLAQLGISPFDERLRRWRESTLRLFERAWAIYIKWGIDMEIDEASSLYLHCLAKILRMNKIEIPEGLIKEDERMTKLINEASG